MTGEKELQRLVVLWVFESELTSGTKGGSCMPASNRFQFMHLKNSCCLISRAPYRQLWQPSRVFGDFFNSCQHHHIIYFKTLFQEIKYFKLWIKFYLLFMQLAVSGLKLVFFQEPRKEFGINISPLLATPVLSLNLLSFSTHCCIYLHLELHYSVTRTLHT